MNRILMSVAMMATISVVLFNHTNSMEQWIFYMFVMFSIFTVFSIFVGETNDK
jgi:hypothetical protein